MADESNEGTWYWLKPDRQQAQGSLEELRGLLAARALPRSTLVWFDDWPEWRSATRVPELASALPASSARGQKQPGPASRPASMESVPRPSTATSTSHSAPIASAVAPPRESKAAESPDTKPSASSESKAAAAPEPKPAEASGSTTAAGPESKAAASGPREVRIETAAPSVDVARAASDRFGTFDNIFIRRSTVTSDAPMEVAVGPAGPSAPAPKSRGMRNALVATSAGCVVLAVGLGVSLRSEAPRPSEPAPAARPAAPPSPPPGCAVVTTSSKLAPSFEREIAPDMVALSGDRVAIGFAARPKEAAGVVVDLGTLDARSAFAEASERGVIAVTPTTETPLTFAVDRDDGVLASTVALDTSPRRLVGVSAQGLVARAGTEDATPLWSIAKRPITTPRVAHLTPSGFALVFRAGGVQGDIVVGWLDADGRAVAELQTVDAGAQFVGTPAIAAGPGGPVIAFATRNGESEPWRLKLVRASDERRLERPIEFALPAEDLGAGAIAPALSPSSGNRWLLQWTQGEPGKLRVRVQELNAELQALGSAAIVSPMGANAGQGSLWSLGDRILSLFVLPVPGRDELWGAVLKCR